jgi:LPXTG-motif cell wall-anchored protein
LGWIGIVWGGAIVVTRLLGSGSSGGESGAYAAGQTGGLVLGFLLLGVGAYYAFRKQKAT